jgi:hypothetical protein
MLYRLISFNFMSLSHEVLILLLVISYNLFYFMTLSVISNHIMSFHVILCNIMCHWTFPSSFQVSRAGQVRVKYVFLGLWRQLRCQAKGKNVLLCIIICCQANGKNTVLGMTDPAI